MSHPLLDDFEARDPERRLAACRAMADDPAAVLFVDALVKGIADSDPRIRLASGRALGEIGRRDDEVLSALRPVLHDGAPASRLEAAWTWSRIEPPPIALLPVVVALLDHLQGSDRWRAGRLLVELGRVHDEARAVVLALARPQQPPTVRRVALAALRRLAPHEPETLHLHLDASRDADPGLARLALASLSALGDPTDARWQRCVEVLETSRDSGQRRVARRVVDGLGPVPPHLEDRLARATRPGGASA